jgi:hypothetical protein
MLAMVVPNGCMYAYFVFVLSFVVEAMQWADPPSKESYQMSVNTIPIPIKR